MFKLKQLTFGLLVCMAMFTSLTLVSCGSDDDTEPENECAADFATGAATGMFMGDAYTVVQGIAKEDFADSTAFRFALYGEVGVGDLCDNFNFERPALSIIFSIPMEVGVYELGSSYTLTFNDASVLNEVTADVAVCGAIEILTITDTQVTGRLDADANADSKLNGTFTVVRCN